MKIKQIASAYGVTVSAVNKWTKSKREQAIRNLQAGVNPIAADLVGELQRECYVAQCHTKTRTSLVIGRDYFAVWHDVEDFDFINYAELNPYELQGAIVKVKELYKND